MRLTTYARMCSLLWQCFDHARTKETGGDYNLILDNSVSVSVPTSSNDMKFPAEVYTPSLPIAACRNWTILSTTKPSTSPAADVSVFTAKKSISVRSSLVKLSVRNGGTLRPHSGPGQRDFASA